MTQQPDAPREEAPVISDRGTFGTPPAQLTTRDHMEASGDRNSLIWGLGVAATIAIALWAVALSLSQATSREVARPVAERGVAVLTGIDGLLDLHLDEVRASAQELDDTAPVTLPGYPAADASWLAVEVRTASRETLRSHLLSRTADLVYVDGISVLAEGGDTFDGGTFSTSSGVRRLLNTLSQSNHDRASTFVWPLGLLALALSVALGIAGSGFARFSVLGTTLLIGALPAIALGALLRLIVALAGSDGTLLADEFSSMAATVAWMPTRIGVTLLLVGLALLIPALILHALFDRSIGGASSELSDVTR
jgi:hypothetical protein